MTIVASVEYKNSSYLGFAKKDSVPDLPSSIFDKPDTTDVAFPTISPESNAAIC
jgi:hypothetical protein